MKTEYKDIIVKAMPLIISSLVVEHTFLSVFQVDGILDDDSIEEIMVSQTTSSKTKDSLIQIKLILCAINSPVYRILYSYKELASHTSL